MSSKEDTKTDPVRQENCNVISPIDQQERFYKIWADVGEVVFNVISGEIICLIARRLSLLAKGVWLPSSGCGDSNTVAALMDLSESRTAVQLNKNGVPRALPGGTAIYRFSEVPGAFNAPPSKLESPAPKKRIPKRK